jgi:hypothetical protein
MSFFMLSTFYTNLLKLRRSLKAPYGLRQTMDVFDPVDHLGEVVG